MLRTQRIKVISTAWRLSSISRVSSLLERVASPDRANAIALIGDDHPEGQKPAMLTYGELDRRSSLLATKLVHLPSSPVGAFTKPSLDFVIAMLAAWKAQKAFVPLSNTHSLHEINYFIENSQLSTIVCPSAACIPQQLGQPSTPLLTTGDLYHTKHQASAFTPPAHSSKDALIIYTSGTTGRPKGVVHTHSSVAAQIRALSTAWEYARTDRILHFLPLYHMHGLLNKLFCMLQAGGTVQFLPAAAPRILWKALASEPQPDLNKLSLFMAVPTVYAKMIEYAPQLSAEEREAGLRTLKAMRLTVSGSAALPDTVLHKWKDLTGHMLLERYGMTELGMALSNPLHGHRQVGAVGKPLESVRCRLVDEQNQPTGHQGELQVAGPSVFKEYLGNAKATQEAFDGEWFRTGDIAQVDEDGCYRILGRASSDIIKSSGYKISALEIERELLSFPRVREAVVVGVPDETLGERIIAIIVPADDKVIDKDIRAFLADRLAQYKQPRAYHFVDHVPRNQLGKVSHYPH